MVSSFFGLEIARRALQSQQTALDTTGHNISNANTPGYTRQIVNLQATYPLTIPGNKQVGTGVTVADISRARDNFVDYQYRNETSKQEYWSGKQDALTQIEAMLNEPNEFSLHNDLDKFWNAWSDLSNDPENMAARAVVAQRAVNLTDSFHAMSQKLDELQENLDTTVRMQVDEINGYATQIAELNKQIAHLTATGGNPNDLYDKRDLLIDDLSKIVNVKVTEKTDPNIPGKQVTIVIGDPTAIPQQTLVDGGATNLLEAQGSPMATVKWPAGVNGGAELKFADTKGSLLAAIEVRGDATGQGGYVAQFKQQMNELATEIANAVNTLHKNGQDLNGSTTSPNGGIDFFTSSSGTIDASTIRVNQNIVDDVSKIAAANFDATGVNTGDGSVAQAISSLSEGWAALASAPIDATSFRNFYSAAVAKVGVDVQQADRMQSMQTSIVTQLSNQRESVSGVSLDEEMINMVKFQKGYSAAARVVTVMDELLDTIIHGMGITR